MLGEAARYAEQTGADRWDFAVELEELLRRGLSRHELRLLVRRGMIEHKREVTADGHQGRVFRRTGDLAFPEGTCFVLAEVGGRFPHDDDRTLQGRPPEGIDLPDEIPSAPRAVLTLSSESEGLPHWDSDRRVLRFDDVIVKRFKWPALNQEAILNAFHEEGWPARIDDPLPPLPEQDPKRRLSDTIKCLNRKQKNRLLRFSGDGTGEGVFWEFIHVAPSGKKCGR
ncbi:hypothetical protein [Planctomycetes bacterium Pan216]|uniref:hypothetical protein n=1 Tax=Kolteria novifilia TaxID=2527975 RepID=UPI0011A13B8F